MNHKSLLKKFVVKIKENKIVVVFPYITLKAFQILFLF